MHLVVAPGGQAEVLEGTIRDDLVRVHVRRCSGPALEDVDDELVIEQAVHDVLAGALDGLRAAGVDQPELMVGADGGQLDRAQAGHQRGDGTEIGVPLAVKFSRARAVCTPQYAAVAGIVFSPRKSR